MFNNNSEWRHGWVVVLGAALGMGTGYGLLMMTSGLFLKPMQEDFGWSRTALSFLPIISVISAFMLPATGHLLDKFGARLIACGGLVALIIGYILMVFVPKNLIIFYLVIGFLGVVVSFSGGISWVRGVATWFEKSRGTAFGLSMCGTSIMSAIVIPILSYIILTYSWRAGFITLAGITLLFGLPAALLFFREKQQPKNTPKKEVSPLQPIGFRIALTSRRFWLLTTCFSLVSIPLGGFMMHLIPIFTDKGIDTATAAMAGSAFALSIAFGRVAAGVLLDRLWPPAVAAFFFMMPIIGVFLLNDLQSGLLSAAMLATLSGVFIGFAQGAEADFIAYFTARYYPLEVFGRVYSLIAVGTFSMMSLGGLLFSSLHDLFGHHQFTFYISALCYFSASLLILFVERIEHDNINEKVCITSS